MTMYIYFKNMEEGVIPCGDTINRNTAPFVFGFGFEVDGSLDDFQKGSLQFKFVKSDDDLPLVSPSGEVLQTFTGKIVRLNTSEITAQKKQQTFLFNQKKLEKRAKVLIATTIEKNVGSQADQLNAATSANPDIQKQWQAKWKLRDAIKFEHGNRLKNAIRNAQTLSQLEKIKTTMTENWPGWAKD